VRPLAVLCLLLLALAGCSSRSDRPPPPGHYKLGKPYQVNGKWYRPHFDPSYRADGIASWYGGYFHGRATANGEVFDKDDLSAAHTTLPLPSLVRVTNLENGRQRVLRVNDRGPFVGDRLIDLSQRAARELGFEHKGLARVRVEFVGLADGIGTPPTPSVRYAASSPPQPEPRARWVAAGAAPEPAAARSCGAAEAAAFIQVAAFSEPRRAEELARRLGQTHPTRVVAHRAEGVAFSRVQLGPIPDPERAREVLLGLQAIGFRSAFLAPAPGSVGVPPGAGPQRVRC
jgi:peptidoglycan lytic transglycosylase